MGKRYCMETDDIVVAFADNHLHGGSVLGHRIVKPEDIPRYEYDKVVICIFDRTAEGFTAQSEMLNQLISIGIPKHKIAISLFAVPGTERRLDFLRFLKDIIIERSVEGAVAECGVFRGHFAGYLNTFFPDRKLYLFDTFEGFAQNDIVQENYFNKNEEFEKWKDFISFGSEEIALLRCPHRENVIIKKGFVPDTFKGVTENFCFVNLDMDLYAPTLSALRFFVPRLSPGGLIVVHDYYHHLYQGIKQAVTDFSQECSIAFFPIGDDCSVAITGLNG